MDTGTSFELDDFDPLNQNAKQLPIVSRASSVVLSQIPSTVTSGTTTAQNRSQAFSNPVYPFYLPGQQPHQITLPSSSSTSSTASVARNSSKSDDDIELLRKYGLDSFKLVDVNRKMANNLKTNQFMINSNNLNANGSILTGNDNGRDSNVVTNFLKTNGDIGQQNQQRNNNNWTTFD